MNLNSRKALIERLSRGPKSREQFVDSHLSKGISHQLRATRDQLGWSQERLASEVGMNQNAISRLESPGYGKPTITTLKRLAAAMDVGLVVHFVPFSQIIDWVSGTRRVDYGLTSASLAVPSFSMEEKEGIFDGAPDRIWVVQTPKDAGRIEANSKASALSVTPSGANAADSTGSASAFKKPPIMELTGSLRVQVPQSGS